MLHTEEEKNLNGVSEELAPEDNGAGDSGHTEPVSGEDLFAAYQEGKSIEELNEMLRGASAAEDAKATENAEGEDYPPSSGGDALNPSTADAVPLPPGEGGEKAGEASETGAEKGVPEGNGAPFKVYQTKEDFQRHFDHEWNKRHKETKLREEEQTREMAHVRELLAGMLGVSEEQAIEELARRRYSMEAEQKGIENPEQYAQLRTAQEENKQLRQRAQDAARQQEAEQNARQAVESIRRQGEELGRQVTGFNLDAAMENEAFRRTIFSLHRAGDERAVENAYRAVYFDDIIQRMRERPPKAETPKRPAQERPKEGGATRGAGGQVKPVDFSSMTSKQILELEKRVLSGEKIF